MTDKLDFGRSFRGPAWALAGVCCVGLLSLGTTNCLPAPANDTTASGGESSSGGGSGGNSSSGNPSGGSTDSGGATNSGGTTSRGGSTNSGGNPNSGGTTSRSGGTNSGGSNNSGGTQNSGGTTISPSGGATVVSSGGVTSAGGLTTAGGNTGGPASCTTDLMTLRAMPDYNWIPVTPPSCTVQGALYAYSDGSTCTSPSPITADACTATGCCISGATVLDATSAKWGCGLGLDLNSATGAGAAKSPYAGAAKGFTITIAGTVAAGQKIRIQYPSTATPPVGGTAPYKEVAGVGVYSVLFSDATCPTWATGGKCTPVSGSGAYSIQVQLSGGTTAADAVGAFSNVCITSIVPM